jgi:hypothetical protein
MLQSVLRTCIRGDSNASLEVLVLTKGDAEWLASKLNTLIPIEGLTCSSLAYGTK